MLAPMQKYTKMGDIKIDIKKAGKMPAKEMKESPKRPVC